MEWSLADAGGCWPGLAHAISRITERGLVLGLSDVSGEGPVFVMHGMTWSEIFSRIGIFLTVLSASVVAPSLAAQGTGLGQTFASSPAWCFRSGSLSV
jgi:hypothetical protein